MVVLKKTNKDRRRSIFFRLFVSYVVILLLPVILGSVMYTRIDSIMVENANRSNAAMLEQVMNVMDSQMKEIDNLTVQLALHPKLPRMLDQKTNQLPENIFPLLDLIKEMSRYSSVSNFAEDFYIYLANSDTILTPTMKTDSKTFFNNIYHYENMTYEEYATRILTSYRNKVFFPSEEIKSNQKKMKMITYVQSLPLGEMDNINGSIVLLINEQKIKNMMTKIEGMQEGEIFILNNNREVLTSTSDQSLHVTEILESILPSSGQLNRKGSVEYSVEQKDKMMLTYTTSNQNNWIYVSIIPKYVVLSQVNTVKMWSLIAVALCLAGGGGVCYYMAYRNYRPIRKLVDAVMKGRKLNLNNKKNEFDFIQETVTTLFHKEKDLESKLSLHMPVIQVDFLSRLIRGQVDADTVTKQDLDFMDVTFPHTYFSVVIIDLDDCSGFIKQDTEREWALIRFIVKNLTNELLQQHHYALEMERNRIVILINQPDSFLHKSINNDFANKLIEYMYVRFRSEITVALGTIHQGLAQIGDCYNEAIFAMEYKMIKGPRSVLDFEDVCRLEHPSYHYPIETETQLMNFIRNGDFVHAEQLLNQIYEVNFHSHGMSPEMGRYLFFDLYGTVLKLSHSLRIDRQVFMDEEHNTAKMMFDNATADEMFNKIKHYFEGISTAVTQSRTGHGEKLYQKIVQYIDEHYTDSMFNLAMMADHLQLNASYISTFFKNYSGYNITDYIVSIRVNESKRLLIETSLTVSDIAEKVGYASNIGLIRMFKKIEGITPGQYRTNPHPTSSD